MAAAAQLPKSGQKKFGFGLELLAQLTRELRDVTPDHLKTKSESELLQLMQRLPNVTDASRELFVRRLQQRLEEVSNARRAAGPRNSAMEQFEKDYCFGQTLGKGAFGRVFFGQRLADGVAVAIKVVDKAMIRTKGLVLLVQDERNLLGAIRGHPFVLHFESSLSTRNNLLLLTDLAVAGDLYHAIKMQANQFFSEPVARFYIAQMVLAFDYLNGVRLMMRDLKLENVFLMADGYVKLGDLGFAKYLPANQRANTFVGSIEYMCPEIIGHQPYGFEADWWSLGVFSYELLCGRTPFLCPTDDNVHFFRCNGNHSQREVMERVQKAHFGFVPTRIWQKLEAAKAFILLLLQSNPQKRVGWQPRSATPLAFFTPTQLLSNEREPVSSSSPSAPISPAACYSVEQLRYDRWFEGHIDWNALYERRLPLPQTAANPRLNGIALDEPLPEDEFDEF